MIGNVYVYTGPGCKYLLQVVRDCTKWDGNWGYFVAIHRPTRKKIPILTESGIIEYIFVPLRHPSLIKGKFGLNCSYTFLTY